MGNSQLDLANIFQTVTSTLAQNQGALNEADTYNHDHGTHMVDIFSTITKAVGSQQGSDAAAQLKFAGEQLLKGEHSGSADMYGKNLLDAASQLKGQQLTADSGMQLVQMLLGAHSSPPSSNSSPPQAVCSDRCSAASPAATSRPAAAWLMALMLVTCSPQAWHLCRPSSPATAMPKPCSTQSSRPAPLGKPRTAPNRANWWPVHCCKHSVDLRNKPVPQS